MVYMKTNKIVSVFILLFVFLAIRHESLAWWPFPSVGIKLPTSTPTPTLKFIQIDPQIKISGILFFPSATPTLTLTPTLTPTETPPPPTPTLTPVIPTPTSDIKPSVAIATIAPTKSAGQKIAGSATKEIALAVGLIAVTLLLLIQSWPKIKIWLHEKTK